MSTLDSNSSDSCFQPAILRLSEEAMDMVRERVSQGGFADASEYVESLVRSALTHEQHARLERELLKALDSGPSLPMDDEYWTKLRERVRMRLADKGRSAA